MAKFRMVALTNPVEGQEVAFNDWYRDVHLPELMSFEGMVSAQRYKAAVPLQTPLSFAYLAIYDMETDDIGALLQRIGSAGNTSNDAADLASAFTVIFNEIGEPVTHEQAAAKLGVR